MYRQKPSGWVDEAPGGGEGFVTPRGFTLPRDDEPGLPNEGWIDIIDIKQNTMEDADFPSHPYMRQPSLSSGYEMGRVTLLVSYAITQ